MASKFNNIYRVGQNNPSKPKKKKDYILFYYYYTTCKPQKKKMKFQFICAAYCRNQLWG